MTPLLGIGSLSVTWTCPYCTPINSAGQHALSCPNHPGNKVAGETSLTYNDIERTLLLLTPEERKQKIEEFRRILDKFDASTK